MSGNNRGKFSLQENKLRISNTNGVSSVLFEDISSISYVSNSTIDKKQLLISFIISSIGWGYGSSIDSDKIMNYTTLFFVGMVIYLFFNKLKWDTVTVETRGGKLISYSVDFGNGKKDVEKIEKLKREITKK